MASVRAERFYEQNRFMLSNFINFWITPRGTYKLSLAIIVAHNGDRENEQAAWETQSVVVPYSKPPIESLGQLRICLSPSLHVSTPEPPDDTVSPDTTGEGRAVATSAWVGNLLC